MLVATLETKATPWATGLRVHEMTSAVATVSSWAVTSQASWLATASRRHGEEVPGPPTLEISPRRPGHAGEQFCAVARGCRTSCRWGRVGGEVHPVRVDVEL